MVTSNSHIVVAVEAGLADDVQFAGTHVQPHLQQSDGRLTACQDIHDYQVGFFQMFQFPVHLMFKSDISPLNPLSLRGLYRRYLPSGRARNQSQVAFCQSMLLPMSMVPARKILVYSASFTSALSSSGRSTITSD